MPSNTELNELMKLAQEMSGKAAKENSNVSNDNGMKKPVVKKPRAPKFEASTLQGSDGLRYLYKEFPKKVKYSGHGHEASALRRLVTLYKSWAFNAYPGRLSFQDMLAKIEKLGTNKLKFDVIGIREKEFLKKHGGGAVESSEEEEFVPDAMQTTTTTTSELKQKSSTQASQENDVADEDIDELAALAEASGMDSSFAPQEDLDAAMEATMQDELDMELDFDY
eukprot:g397.t1